MSRSKRLIALNLVLLMLLTLIPSFAFAAADKGSSIELKTGRAVYSVPDDSVIHYGFTPKASGSYVIFFDVTTGALTMYNGSQATGVQVGADGYYAELRSGTAYTLEQIPDEEYRTHGYTISVSKIDPPMLKTGANALAASEDHFYRFTPGNNGMYRFSVEKTSDSISFEATCGELTLYDGSRKICSNAGVTENTECAAELRSGQTYILYLDEVWKTGYSYSLNIVYADDHHTHSYAASVTKPTCTAQGFTTYTCSCGDSYKSNYTKALGHNYVKGVCTRCSAKDPDYKAPNPFKDVKSSDYFYGPVMWAVENGITKGTSATTFSPEATCTRGQIVAFLWRACGSPAPVRSNNPFTDVKSSDYFYKAVLWAVENGITKGTSATTFSPDAFCTRAQAVTFLWRAIEKPTPKTSINPFGDVRSGEYYYDAVLWAVGDKITKGTSATTFSPDDFCTRGQIVSFLQRTFDK